MKIFDENFIHPGPSLNSVIRHKDHPFNVFERLAVAENYDYSWSAHDEFHLSVPGAFRDHNMVISWNPAREKLSIFLAFDGYLPSTRRDDLCRLICLINERLPCGHFDFWGQNAALVYRDYHSLRGGAKLITEQAMELIATALDAAERGYPAAQYVIWAGKSPEDAINSALIDIAAQN